MEQQSDLPKWMGKREAMAYLRIGLATLNRWVKRGTIPATRMGRFVRFLETDIVASMEKNRIKPA